MRSIKTLKVLVIILVLLSYSVFLGEKSIVADETDYLWQHDFGESDVRFLSQDENHLLFLNRENNNYSLVTIDIVDGSIEDSTVLELDGSNSKTYPFVFDKHVVFTHDQDQKISTFDKETGEKISTLNILDAPEIPKSSWIISVDDLKENLLVAIIETSDQEFKICVFDIQTSKVRFVKDSSVVSCCFIKNGKIFAFTTKGLIVYRTDGQEISRIEHVVKFPSNILPEFFAVKGDSILWVDDNWDINFYVVDTKTNEVTTNKMLCECDCECGFAKYGFNSFYNVIIYGDKDDLDIQHIIILSNDGGVLNNLDYNSADSVWIHGIVGNKLILSDNQKLFSLDFTNGQTEPIEYDGVIEHFDPANRILINISKEGLITAHKLNIDIVQLASVIKQYIVTHTGFQIEYLYVRLNELGITRWIILTLGDKTLHGRS